MPTLPKPFIRQLQAEAHHLKAVVTIGKDGLNAEVIRSIYEAFNTRELIKVKMLDNSPEERDSLREKLSNLPEIHMIQNIGHTYVLYKKLEEEKA